VTVRRRRSGAFFVLALLAFVAAACAPTQPSASAPGSGALVQPSAPAGSAPAGSAPPTSAQPTAAAAESDDVGPGPAGDDFVLGCISIAAAECEFVADLVLARLPDEREMPVSILINLYGCGSPCAKSLDAREGAVTVEYADGGEPIDATVHGPAEAPVFGEVETGWSGLLEPTSARVDGTGPFAYELGHCGLLWQVDFDGSFWLPVGQVDGDAADLFNAGSGEIVLLEPNVAQFEADSGFTVQLARFPGPKHVFLCR
jgi:hypothetical protein